jgi:colanic acid/amylovoran biosynthesis protein
MIGGASLVISSRFHGLVNALSQSVPAIGTSWSHKYGQLAADYACPEAIWDIEPPDVAEPRLREWLSDDQLAARRIALRSKSTTLKEATRSMWTEVRSAISP